MIAEKSPVLEKAAARLTEVSEDMRTRHRLESYRLYEMDQRVKARAAKREAEEEMRKVREEARMAREEGREEGMEKTMELLEQGYTFDEIKKMLRDGGGQGRKA